MTNKEMFLAISFLVLAAFSPVLVVWFVKMTAGLAFELQWSLLVISTLPVIIGLNSLLKNNRGR